MAKFERREYQVYTPEMARYLVEAEGFDVRREYTRMRKVAQDRLYKLVKHGFTTFDIVASNVNRFPRLVEIGNDKQMLYDALSEVSRFLNLQQSTVGGMHEKERKWREKFEQHYTGSGLKPDEQMPNVDYRLFGEMMCAIKSHAMSKIYYNCWKQTYRKIVASAEKHGWTPAELADMVRNEQITIGPRGGLYDAETQRRITRTWDRMGK